MRSDQLTNRFGVGLRLHRERRARRRRERRRPPAEQDRERRARGPPLLLRLPAVAPAEGSAHPVPEGERRDAEPAAHRAEVLAQVLTAPQRLPPNQWRLE